MQNRDQLLLDAVGQRLELADAAVVSVLGLAAELPILAGEDHIAEVFKCEPPVAIRVKVSDHFPTLANVDSGQS